MWYKRETAIHPKTGKELSLVRMLSEFDDRIYPTMFFEHFNSIPNFNTFTLVMPEMVIDVSEEETEEG